MKKANDMSQAAADVLDGVNKINDILKPYFTNAGETMRNDIENAANEIQNAVNYANNAINGIKSIFTVSQRPVGYTFHEAVCGFRHAQK